ncbi:MAG: DUF2085 domain-containing protein [Chloroflexota bacterium]
MITVNFYMRPNCPLCDSAKADLDSLQHEIPHKLNIIDIEQNPESQKKYFLEIPVVEAYPYILKYPFTRQNLLATLNAAKDGEEQRTKLASGSKLAFADRFSIWIGRHWLFVINLIFIIYLGLPILAPVLMKAGAQLPAKIIYTAYSPLCHQLGFRSFFLFGEQPFYPRSAAGIANTITFGQATNINENDLISARRFLGNEQLGYKIALCERDVAIYGAIILFGFLFALSGRKIKPLHWAVWLVIFIAPVGLDGFSQLFSQLPVQFIQQILPYRESTPLLRVITGFLFGFGTAWFGFPYVQESMSETLEIFDKKMEVSQGNK